MSGRTTLAPTMTALGRCIAGPSRLRIAPILQLHSHSQQRYRTTSTGKAKMEEFDRIIDPKTGADSRETQVPYLGRPLGVDDPPKASSKNHVLTGDSAISRERRMQERKVLMKQAGTGYYHDLNAARGASGGKLWTAPRVLIREDKALYFPNIAGNTLERKPSNTTSLLKGKTSLLTITTTQLSEEHVQSFVRDVLEEHAGEPDFQWVRINHQENHLKAALVQLFPATLQRTVPPEQWSKYLMTKGEWSELDIKAPLGLGNKIVGFCYLIDKNCKVRWGACSLATEEEVSSLRTATSVLLERTRSRSDKL